MQGIRGRHNGRVAEFIETLSMLIVGGALLGLALVVAALLMGWATAVVAEESGQVSVQFEAPQQVSVPFNS